KLERDHRVLLRVLTLRSHGLLNCRHCAGSLTSHCAGSKRVVTRAGASLRKVVPPPGGLDGRERGQARIGRTTRAQPSPGASPASAALRSRSVSPFSSG